MRKNPKTLLFLLLVIILSGCNTYKHPFYSNSTKNWKTTDLASDDILHQIFLVGDAGVAETNDPIMTSLYNDLSHAGKDDVVVFLGDNIYPEGLPPEGHPKRAEAQGFLDAQINAVLDFKGHKYFVPGNHDWKKGTAQGLEYIQRQQQYIESRINEKEVFLPKNGCGTPEKERISDDVVMIFLDTQWWLQDWDTTPEINRGCEIEDRIAFLDELKDLLDKYDKKQVVMVMHHPLFSNGAHGGYFSAKQNIFPITDASKNAYIPLPGIGSLYTLYRKTSGNIQDIPHTKYNSLKEELLKVLAPYKNLIVAAGHEHSLQYFAQNEHHFIVSGAGSKNSYARKGVNAEFVTARKGYSKLTILKNGDTWLEFYAFQDGQKEKVLQQKIVTGLTVKNQTKIHTEKDEVFPDSIIVKPSSKYARENGAFFFGEQYRKVWDTDVKVPVFLLNQEKGGLKILKQGGGQSSLSLRLEDSEGKQFVLRTVDKRLEKALPEFVRNTWAIDLAQDQISAIHPFGATAVAHLAETAGIYHTNPKIVWLPRQNALGDYNERFADQLFLFEERPSGNRAEVSSFGNSTEIINYRDLIKELEKNPKASVDQSWVLRSRIFDMFIHDWDRHDDQWRWASFKDGKETIYRPIPRDRDQPFYKFKGFVPWLGSRGFAVPKFQTFDTNIKNVKGWNFNARYFDRYFLNETTKEDWIKAAKQLEEQLTDKAIDEAFKVWPEEIQKVSAEEITTILKVRKSNLVDIAERQYLYLSRAVNIVGTSKKEEFEITRHSSGNVHVKMLDKNEKNILYNRTFYPDETKEIRIYGKEGNDDFKFLGSANNQIKVRIIGGQGEDEIKLEDPKSISSSNTILYDNLGDLNDPSNRAKNKTSNDFDVNRYNRTAFKPNTYIPSLNIAFNKDDGLLIGPGIGLTNHGFRKDPYKAKYSFTSNFSPTTNAFNINGKADWKDVLGKKTGLGLEVNSNTPGFENWYGDFAGSSTFDDTLPREFYWVRLDNTSVEAIVKRQITSSSNSFIGFGPLYEHFQIDPRMGRVEVPSTAIPEQNLVGAKIVLSIDSREGIPVQNEGLTFNLAFQHLSNLDDADSNIRNASGDLGLIFNLGRQANTILATRFGGASVVGDYQFYQAPSLGNNTFLRGYRRDRFVGKQIFYQNIDLRQKLFYWKNKILPTQVGLVAGFDNGKAWHPSGGSTDWNSSLTGGVWFTPFNVAVLTTGYSKPLEEVGQATVQLGFFF